MFKVGELVSLSRRDILSINIVTVTTILLSRMLDFHEKDPFQKQRNKKQCWCYIGYFFLRNDFASY